jgi:hypothetical protein
MTRMIVCPRCGNKRCPHASDHRNACTNSNEPGQPGSVYGPNNPDGIRKPCNCGADLSVDAKRRLRAFARECIRNSGGDPDAQPGAPSLPCREGE